MTGNMYQSLALVTANKEMLREQESALLNGVLGMCGESGEIADMFKKRAFQGHDLDMEEVAKELGDVLWYVALAAHAAGYELDTIMQMNVAKLKARYPEGFRVGDSVNRRE